MILDYIYQMTLHFSKPVKDHHFSVMCIPRETSRQRNISNEILVSPDCICNRDTDGYGNHKVYGLVQEDHDSFILTSRGRVETSICEEGYTDPSSYELFNYLVTTRFTVAGPKIQSLYQEWIETAPEDTYGKVLHFGNCVQSALSYVSQSTNVSTTAEEACILGSGVCQDYSHVFISLLRLAGIPARYVAGMMVGEGASHAWVEANCNGYWYGLDPTNNLLVNENYIKLSHGRDYEDCMISRGIFTNPYAIQTMDVMVKVNPGDC